MGRSLGHGWDMSHHRPLDVLSSRQVPQRVRCVDNHVGVVRLRYVRQTLERDLGATVEPVVHVRRGKQREA